jgi:hypothetical protein
MKKGRVRPAFFFALRESMIGQVNRGDLIRKLARIVPKGHDATWHLNGHWKQWHPAHTD